MILRRIVESLRSQNWRVALLELAIIIVGVFVGLQVDTWSNSRQESERREQIVNALATNLADTVGVQERVNIAIESGLAEWQSARAEGRRPPPYYFRHVGSDMAPDMWSTLEQMQLSEMFDPATLFDLTAYFSELDGVSHKYIRYVTFVEDEILPGIISSDDVFYDENGELKARFQANMDRLREHAEENQRLMRWANCLVTRLRSDRTFSETCYRTDNRLDEIGNERR
ncbi:MAG: hypothetical protein AAF518_07515 [Spirochaetota bacterium]